MKILVPVDGSESSMQGVSTALDLAKSKGAGVCLLTVVPPMADFDHELSASQREVVTASLTRHAEEVIGKAKDAFVANGIIPLVEIRSDVNSIAEEICGFVEREGIDIVVMGRKGLKRLERAVMGSVTARVIGCSPVDVLVVPRDASTNWQRVVVATDGSKCSKAATQSAIDIARSHGAELKVISVVDVPDEAYAEAPNAIDRLLDRAREIAEAVKEEAESSNIKAAAVVRSGEAHTVIVDVARQSNADLICLGSHGRTGLRRFVMGSVTEKVIGAASSPVLVVKSC